MVPIGTMLSVETWRFWGPEVARVLSIQVVFLRIFSAVHTFERGIVGWGMDAIAGSYPLPMWPQRDR